MILALSLARSGRIDEAERLANEVSQEAPLDTTVQMYLVPTVRAAVKLQQHDRRRHRFAPRDGSVRSRGHQFVRSSLSGLHPRPGLSGVRRWPSSSARVPKADRQSRFVPGFYNRPTGPASTRSGTETDGRQRIRANLTKNSFAFGKTPTTIFPSIDRPKPSTPS